MRQPAGIAQHLQRAQDNARQINYLIDRSGSVTGGKQGRPLQGALAHGPGAAIDLVRKRALRLQSMKKNVVRDGGN